MSLDTERLMKNARSRLPGAIDTVLELELFNVLDEFFQDSNVWQEAIEFSVTAADEVPTIYYIEPESVSSIVRLISVVTSEDRPVAATMQVPGEVILLTQPGGDETYTATVAMTVDDPVQSTNNYPEFPAWVLTKYGMALLDGLLGRMMSQPAKPYSNTQLALYHTRKFRSAIAFASTESVRRNVANAQVWRFPQSFATRRS
jgi:hypothetical protein